MPVHNHGAHLHMEHCIVRCEHHNLVVMHHAVTDCSTHSSYVAVQQQPAEDRSSIAAMRQYNSSEAVQQLRGSWCLNSSNVSADLRLSGFSATFQAF